MPTSFRCSEKQVFDRILSRKCAKRMRSGFFAAETKTTASVMQWRFWSCYPDSNWNRVPRNRFRGSPNDLGLKKCAYAHLGMRSPVLPWKKENHRISDAVAFFGAAIQIRTGDLILTKDALYLLSYSSISDSFDIIAREWAAVNSFFQILRLFLHDARRRRCGEGHY